MIQTVTTIPSQITICGLTGGAERWLIIRFDLSKPPITFVQQAIDALPSMVRRAQAIGVEYVPESFPVVFWDLFGDQGLPIRATITEMGPLLVSRLLDLNDVQAGIINIAFRVSADKDLQLFNLKDLRAMLGFLAENEKEIDARYGNIARELYLGRSNGSSCNWKLRELKSFLGNLRSKSTTFSGPMNTGAV